MKLASFLFTSPGGRAAADPDTAIVEDFLFVISRCRSRMRWESQKSGRKNPISPRATEVRSTWGSTRWTAMP